MDSGSGAGRRFLGQDELDFRILIREVSGRDWVRQNEYGVLGGRSSNGKGGFLGNEWE